MKFNAAVENIATITELKRVASAYVIDYRALSEDEIRAALKKTAPQYHYADNVKKALDPLMQGDDRGERILSHLLLFKSRTEQRRLRFRQTGNRKRGSSMAASDYRSIE